MGNLRSVTDGLMGGRKDDTTQRHVDWLKAQSQESKMCVCLIAATKTEDSQAAFTTRLGRVVNVKASSLVDEWLAAFLLLWAFNQETEQARGRQILKNKRQCSQSV